ncbi:sugar/nucleoside kinase (ribokinase family) [Sphingomonas sp. PP-F2F-A104-K0414]|uniref:carbohydrate kinase family protein n=1 Tax=Sphingomonas sp. PP-F2F-A104-K0414 TaxID=2135661 RepID=UPI0010473CEA|nr:carbohydrate kinase family protein [Sphingomonas sp. PP-F2F-A104-K0414]TCP96762.1 sugar/nucleoside kinase (ribokinase family) [Sphingomonas sp. PP-F2F-A104-K0414]
MTALPTPRFDVAIIGEIYVDHVFSGFASWPKPGEEVVTDAYVRAMGGGAAATACGLARLGRTVALVGLVGADDHDWFATGLARYGVVADGLVVGDGATGTTISVSTAEDRSFFTHIGVNHRVGALCAGVGLAVLRQARHVHFAMPLPRDVADAVLPVLAAAGITTSLDMGYQPAWLADPANRPTLAAIDHLLPNEKEAELLCGSPDPVAYFAHAALLPLRHPMLKLGVRGAAAIEFGQIVRITPPSVIAVDATGAGDAFDAGFIDALLDGGDAAARLQRGCITGALSTRKPGALAAIPDRHELRSTHDRTY